MAENGLEDLRLILEESEFLASLIQQKITWQEFRNDAMLLRAVPRSVDVMGALAAQVSPEIKAQFPQIKWDHVIAQREEVNRDYRMIDYERIWAFIHQEIPEIVRQTETALNAMIKAS